MPHQDGGAFDTPILDKSVEKGARDNGLVSVSASWSLDET